MAADVANPSAAFPAAPAGWEPPSKARMAWRGLTHRCAVCGSAHLFSRYFVMAERCPRCGLRFRRLEGHWSGDIGVNTIVTFALLWVVLVGGTLVMWGHLNVVALSVVAALVVFVFPVLFVPFAKTIWVAADLIMRPLEPGEAFAATPATTSASPTTPTTATASSASSSASSGRA